MKTEVKPNDIIEVEGQKLQARQVTRPWCEACYFFDAKAGKCRDAEERFVCDAHYRHDRKYVYFALFGSEEPNDI